MSEEPEYVTRDEFEQLKAEVKATHFFGLTLKGRFSLLLKDLQDLGMLEIEHGLAGSKTREEIKDKIHEWKTKQKEWLKETDLPGTDNLR